MSFQVIKHITNGGTDFSFECVGDTEMITTALQSCCDVSCSISSEIFTFLIFHLFFICFLSYLLGMGPNCNSWRTKSKTRNNSSLCIVS